MDKCKILFVCLGNICRSPAAEAVMKKLVEENKLSDFIEIDSAGTIAYHSGERADPRMISHAAKRNISIDSIARKFSPLYDFDKFDYIVCMDDDNFNTIKNLDTDNLYSHKIFKMTNFSSIKNITSVPDPYYGGSRGFELVLDILEDASKGLLNKIKKDYGFKN